MTKPRELDETCAVCRVPAVQKCGACKLVFYCDKKHQKQHWKQHSKRCKAYQLVENERLGRHYVAVRDVAPGELVIREDRALVQAPQESTVPVCLECLTPLETGKIRACESCGWPLCKDCYEHSGAECWFTQRFRRDKVSISGFGLVHPTYKCIGTVRALALKLENPTAYEKFTSLASRCDVSSEEADLLAAKDIAKFIRRYFDKLVDEFTDDEIVRAAGILQINGHEIPLSEPASVGVYDAASYLEHSCRANCSKTFMSGGGIIIRAILPIKKGEHLTICYTDPLWGTTNRRHHLQRTKFFACSCERCADTTEFGTMFNAIKCTATASSPRCPGYMLPATFLSEELPDYACDKCGEKLASAKVDQRLEEIGKDLASLKKNDLKACRAFVQRHRGTLHDNHFYLTDARVVLAQMIGQEGKGLVDLDDETLSEKILLGKKLSDLMEILVPAENRVRGMILFELHAAMAEFGRRQDRDQLMRILDESSKVLQQSYFLLKFEPDMLPEGKVARSAEKNIDDMEFLIKKLMETVKTPLM